MKKLSPFLNDNDRESTFEYLLKLMDDDLDRDSSIDVGNESEINEEIIDKHKRQDDSSGLYSEPSMENANQSDFCVTTMRYVIYY